LSDTYDWPHIANRYVWDVGQNRWEDENGNPLTQTHLDAVAELCYEVAVAVDMDFGVCFSGAITSDMEGVYENHYRYSTACGKLDRVLFPSVGWYNLMKIQFTLNRPIQYRIKGHSIVADGWEEEEIDGTLTRRYHMNYGWDNSRNTWYTLDALYQPDPDGDTDDEYMLINIYPAQALGSSLSGAYLCNASFPYRYFDQDATGSSAVFTQGQYLQFLPKITVTCTSTTGGNISFIGTSSNNTRLFTRGDTSKGIKITNGALKLYQGGSIKFE
jgi:hypothetical protein